MRGYFGIGVEGISKPMNLGNLMRTAHAFGAGFFFTVNAAFKARDVALSDTSDAARHVPLYVFDRADDLLLPRGCELIGVEFSEQAVELPSFRHPLSAAYVLGPERGSLSPELAARCQAVVKIPTQFCINVGVAGAIVMYDRALALGRHARRPVNPRAEAEPLAEHVRGGPVLRRGANQEQGRPSGRRRTRAASEAGGGEGN